MFLLIIAIIIFICGFIVPGLIDAEDRGKRLIWTAATVVALLLLVVSCVTYVPTGYTGIVTTFGKVHDTTLDAGISFKAPWDNVIRMDNREQRFSFELEAFSKDIQEVDMKGSVNLNIDKSTAMNLYREVGTDYINVLIAPRVQEDIKIVIARYGNMLDSNDALVDEFLRRGLGDKASFYTAFMIFDAYYTMNKPEWINQENREYRQSTELRFARYYAKHRDLWDSIPAGDRMAISNAVRSRSISEGMQMEAVTIDGWLKHIQALLPSE